MTTISPFAAGSYVTGRNSAQLTSLKGQLNDLSNQITTGQVAQTYGGLGTSRSTALAAQATMSALDGYNAGITAAQTRTTLAVASLSQVATLGTGVGTSLSNDLQSTPLSTTVSKSLASSNLTAALDALTQSAGGNYLFGGSNASTQPVLSPDIILNGTTNDTGNPIAGLRTLITEQVRADVGVDGMGRLTQTGPGGTLPSGDKLSTDQIVLTDDTFQGATAQFGYALTGKPTASGSFLSSTYVPATASAPSTLTLSLAAQPSAGDSVNIDLRMPDGTKTTITLTAATSANSSVSGTTFAIGSNSASTAANLSSALSKAVTIAAGSTLTANSTSRAASNFFAASASKGTTPNRITSDPATGRPTGYVTGPASKTVVWYQGEDITPDPRASQSVQVSATTAVNTGARANEPALQNVLAGLATVAFGLPDTSNVNAGATYQAIARQAGTLLSSATTSPSVQDIVTSLSVASSQLSNAATTNTATQNTLQNTLDGIEQAPTAEVAAKLLDLQNRLQASYQVTASLAKLSLVNYIS